MPEISKQTSPSNPSRLASGDKRESVAAWMGANSAFLEAFSQASQSYMGRVSQLGEEIMGFAAGRLQRNSEVGEQLLRCKDLTDAMRVQQDWLRQTAEQYVQEAGKIIELTTKAALASVNPILEQTGAAARAAEKSADEFRKAS